MTEEMCQANDAVIRSVCVYVREALYVQMGFGSLHNLMADMEAECVCIFQRV